MLYEVLTESRVVENVCEIPAFDLQLKSIRTIALLNYCYAILKAETRLAIRLGHSGFGRVCRLNPQGQDPPARKALDCSGRPRRGEVTLDWLC